MVVFQLDSLRSSGSLNMFNRIGLLLLTLPLFSLSCTVDQSESSPLKIIGENELQPVTSDGTNLPENLRPLIGAIGLLRVGCTVTHIGNGLIMTAGHCIPQDQPRSNECLSATYPNMTVQWNYFASAKPVPDSNCLKILSTELSSAHDYAILSVDNAPDAKMDVELNQRPKLGHKITILGHPKKRPMEWSQFCVIADLPADFMTDVSQQDRKDLFAHQCDTEHGNSGSPIIDAESGKLIGIHHGGIDPWNTATWVPASAVGRAIRNARSARP